MTPDDLTPLMKELRELVAERLNVRARTLRGAVAKAGTRLPRAARHAAAEIEMIRARLCHPKLAARTDPALARDAADRFRLALAATKPGTQAARERAVLRAEIAFRILVLLVACLAALYWFGL